MISILEKIARDKRIEVDEAQRKFRISDMQSEDRKRDSRSFINALEQKNPAIIAEIKKASPSKGIIREDFDVKAIAKIYEKHGAACLSVLTDRHYFKGHPDYLEIARASTALPVLRKDFIIDAYQIHESRFLGADCILLIAALLDSAQLQDFCALALELGLSVLVESHDENELERALALPTPLMGINNRSLHDFKTDLEISSRLASRIPPEKIIITESGIHNRADIQKMQAQGIQCFLIGETLMRCKNPGDKLDELLNSG